MFMDFSESVKYLYSIGNEVLAMKLGLETIRILANACGNPQLTYSAIHIAGTNGKGSTAAITESILREARHKTGLFTSPHLVSITERIKINGIDINEVDFARIATIVRSTSESLLNDHLLEAVPTFFEQITMIAYIAFAEHKIDIAILETGMGGRLDATNICNPILTVITPIGYDHQQYLGDTLEKIAFEKAGIIKPTVPVVVAPQQDEVAGVIIKRANELSSEVIHVVEDKGLSPALNGRMQITNASTAATAIHTLINLGWKVTGKHLFNGLKNVRWPGRLQLIDGSPKLLLDGAHNKDGATALRQYLTENFPATPITLIFAAMGDKNVQEMIDILFPVADKIIAAKVANIRAIDPSKIVEMTNKDIIFSDNAVIEAQRITPAHGLICVCGSLYLVGEILAQGSFNFQFSSFKNLPGNSS